MDFDSAEFHDFIHVNTRFWQQFKLPRQELVDRWLVVDFYSCDPASLMLNAILAKLLQLEHGYKLIAITNADYRAMPYKMLALSYGINVVYTVRDIASHTRPRPIDIAQVARDTILCEDPAEIRRRLLDLHQDGLRVGDLIYDSYLRDHDRPTIERADDELFQTLVWGLRWYEFCQWLTDEFDIAGYVGSHNVYVAYGMMARVVTAKGGFALIKRRRPPILFLRQYRSLDEMQVDQATLSADELDFLDAGLGGEAAALGRKAVDLRFAGREAAETTNTLAFDDDRRLYSRAELVGPDRDPAAPIAFLMCQCLPESHGNMFEGYPYDDHLHWLRESCRIAREVPDVTWIVKAHPEHERYTPGVDFHALWAEFGDRGNVLPCPDDFHNGNLDEVADVVVGTGDITLEATWRGIPCIVPSASNPLVPHGWCHSATTREDYEALLRNAARLPRLPQPVVDRSHAYAWFFLENRIETQLIPTYRHWNDHNSEEELYGRAARMLRTADLFADPLVRNFAQMMREDRDHLFPFDRLARPATGSC